MALLTALAEIKTQLARLDDLVEDYLSLVRVANINPTPHDIGAVVQAWTKEWQGLTMARGVTLQLEDIVHLGQVALHESTLHRAMLNLVQNALDAMPQGGTLTPRRPLRCMLLRLPSWLHDHSDNLLLGTVKG